MPRKKKPFDFLEYLANGSQANGNVTTDRLPSLQELSEQEGVSISVLREQLRVARALGLVEVRPRTGIRRLPYSFGPAVQESLFYALALDGSRFDQFADLRKHIERAYWREAVSNLKAQDHADLNRLVNEAWTKLHGHPVQLPHNEHRELHMAIFRNLDNPFVLGLLESYWEAYEEVGLSRYEGLDYLEQVWSYHRRIVEAIIAGEVEASYQALNEHFELIDKRPGLGVSKP
ncbi:MAG: FCD domain-containing protein [Chloroflexi bacterium]|nr:FCD domain-containing protein [Chloroflexota bacterium]